MAIVALSIDDNCIAVSASLDFVLSSSHLSSRELSMLNRAAEPSCVSPSKLVLYHFFLQISSSPLPRTPPCVSVALQSFIYGNFHDRLVKKSYVAENNVDVADGVL